MFRLLILLIVSAVLSAEDLSFHVGALRLIPSGFFEPIGMLRSATTKDTLKTDFGKIPLGSTPSQSFVNLGHSRLMLNGDMKIGRAKITGYAESDFLNDPGNQPFRWRQYWGQIEIGDWQVLGGQAWSLLRPNRKGIQTESGMMNTHVVDPAYHPGLIGRRKRQIRVVRKLGDSTAAFTYDQAHDFSAKFAQDFSRGHVELAGLAGEDRKRAASFASVVHISRVDWVSQQFWSQGAGQEALGMLPAGVHAHATIQGVEAKVTRRLELYAYGGIGYAARSTGNRTVREWSAGFLHRLYNHQGIGAVSISGQYSQLDRSTWSGGHGAMNYVMLSLRYYYPAFR
jgi:hypothetical protein